MENKILYDKSALPFICEALGFYIEKSFLKKEDKFVLINNKKVNISDVLGFQKGTLLIKGEIKFLPYRLVYFN